MTYGDANQSSLRRRVLMVLQPQTCCEDSYIGNGLHLNSINWLPMILDKTRFFLKYLCPDITICVRYRFISEQFGRTEAISDKLIWCTEAISDKLICVLW